MPSFHVLNFGCRASQADGAALKGQLLKAGLAEAVSADASDVAVVNTCTVTAAADAEARQVIRRIHRRNPRCQILVTGCYAQRAPEEIASLDGVTWVVGNSHKREAAEIIARDLGLADNGHDGASFTGQQPAVRVAAIGPEFHFLPVHPDDRTRPTLKVQDGCNARCAFCVIPMVRGRSRSLPPEQVIAEVRRLEAQDYKEIVLSGINLGSYGRDLQPRTSFLGLLERILSETRIARVRISSIEPMDVSPALVRLAAANPRIAEHFHVPLQSGSDRILRQMNRRYWCRHYAERIFAIREALPNAGIGADVMTGFPGESAQDHAASARFIESLPFTYLHVFPFSARPATLAASRADQVNGRIAHERGAELRAIVAAKRRQFLESQVGRVLSVLTLEGGRGDLSPNEVTAMSSNYLRVVLGGGSEDLKGRRDAGATSSVRPHPNQLLDVRIQRVHEDCLYAEGRRTGGSGSHSQPLLG